MGESIGTRDLAVERAEDLDPQWIGDRPYELLINGLPAVFVRDRISHDTSPAPVTLLGTPAAPEASGVRWWAVIRRSPRRTCGAMRGGPKTVAGQPTGNPEPSTHTQPATMPIGDRVGDFDLAAGRAVTRPLVGRAERQ